MTTPIMKSPLTMTDLVDWGVIPTMIEGESRTSGKLLHKGPEGRSECGLWVCTPGKWHCHVTRDCLLYTSPSPRDRTRSRMPSSA